MKLESFPESYVSVQVVLITSGMHSAGRNGSPGVGCEFIDVK